MEWERGGKGAGRERKGKGKMRGKIIYFAQKLANVRFFCNFGTPLKGPSEITVQQCCAFRQVFPQKNIADAITFFSA